MARRLVIGAAALGALLALLEAVGGRAATIVLTGAVGATAPLGLVYVLVWLLAVVAVPSLLLAAVIDVLLRTLIRRKHGA